MPLTSRYRRLTGAILSVVIVASVAGCAPSTASAGATDDVVAACPGADTPLTELTATAAPKTMTGESTACLTTHTIRPVSSTPTPVLPVTVTDNDGLTVTVTSADRIIAVDRSGTLAATVFALGLGDRVIARDSTTDFPEAADLPLITQNGHELAAEAVIALAPTVIVTDRTVGSRDVLAQLREAGIPIVVVTDDRSVEDNAPLIAQVATALGVPEAGQELAEQLQAETDAVIADIAQLAPADPAARPRILFLYLRGASSIYYIFGAESGADSLINSLGGVDVATEIGWAGMKPLTAEALVAASPDVLLVMTSGLESVGGVDGLLEAVPAIAATPAGINRRIVDMRADAVLAFGPRTPEVLDSLARALYAPTAP